MNLALGSLYAWSVFVAPLEKQFGWERAGTSMVFTIAVVVFGLSSSFAVEQSYYRTRATRSTAGTWPLFRGNQARSEHDKRTEVSTIFAF